ncbi:DUF305 domain-containing protein [Paenarthrobacter sp. NPDC092416]|uniref:DUF305 domain-containing protein n=1 Tax=Paenarthrobacter sp. NPDC092416 TaxID=3364386 RepID=UPI0037F71155
MNKNFSTLPAVFVATAIALAGCSAGDGSGSSTSAPGMDNGGHGTMASNAPTAGAEHNSADVMFAQMMIPHHAQAVEMSDMMLAKTGLPAAITELATKIKDAQAPEIQMMTVWLQSWNETVPTTTGGSMTGHAMEGMMSAEDMDKLGAAQGSDAAKLFLTRMIAHHEGAIVMAKTEMDNGKNTEALALSKAIVEAQEAEIKEMQALLAGL